MEDDTVQTVSEPPRVPCEISVLDDNVTGLVLQCESKGWYVRPEVSWLDGEGNVLPADFSEKIRDLDGLYTVRSNVTVKSNNNTCTCRAQQQKRTLPVPAGETTYHAALIRGLGILVSILVICIVCLCRKLTSTPSKKSNMPTQIPVCPSAKNKPIHHSAPCKSVRLTGTPCRTVRQADGDLCDSGIVVSPQTSGLYSDKDDDPNHSGAHRASEQNHGGL